MSRYAGWDNFDQASGAISSALAKQHTSTRRRATASTGIDFARLCALSNLPEPRPEYPFHSTRKWRFDWAWPAAKVALEIHGGTFVQGKHSRGAGQRVDFEKWSEAAVLGWRILHVLPEHLETPRTLDWVRLSLA